MKTYTSSQKCGVMSVVSFGRRIYSAVLVMIFAFVAMSFVSCTPSTKDVVPASLVGTWESQYGEIYTITETTFKNGGSWGDAYAGDNLTVSEIDDSSGYIYFKYTRAAMPDWTYSETAPDVGKWYCVAYKNLSDSGVSFSGAYKDGGKSSTESLEEAKSEFTIENGYFATYSECVKK